MSDPIAIIAPAVDLRQIERAFGAVHVAWQDGERRLKSTEQAVESLRKSQEARRHEMGRLLIEAKRGVRHGGWLPYVERLGIAERTAQVWMQEAGYVATKSAASPDAADIPARVAAGIDKRPRKSDEPTPLADDKPSDDWLAEVEARRKPVDEAKPAPVTPPSIDVDRELSKIVNLIRAVAQAVSTVSRQQMAHELREAARAIEAMP